MDETMEKIIKGLIENRKLRSWVTKLVADDGGNRQDAENLFLKSVRIVWENLERGVLIRDLEAFVKTVARNNWKQQHKRARLRKEKLLDLEFLSVAPSVENEYITKELRALFRKEISQLQEPCHKILYLFYYEGQSHEEIAHQLNNGKDAAWVKRKAYTCRAYLKKALQQLSEFKDLL